MVREVGVHAHREEAEGEVHDDHWVRLVVSTRVHTWGCEMGEAVGALRSACAYARCRRVHVTTRHRAQRQRPWRRHRHKLQEGSGLLTDEELLPGLEHREREGDLDPDAPPPEELADERARRAVGEVEAEEDLRDGRLALPLGVGHLGGVVGGVGHGLGRHGGAVGSCKVRMRTMGLVTGWYRFGEPRDGVFV